MLFEATGLCRSVAGSRIFDDVGFMLSEGETLAVLGPSGSGKTLLLRTLAWLDEADAGRIRLRGQTPPQVGIPAWRRHVTYVAQQPPPLRGTPSTHADAVAALESQQRGQTDDPLELARAWGLSETHWSRPWSALSGGERQRAYLAVAVARRPNVLLLDEPTSALDPDAARAVERTLRERSCVWVTHDRSQAERVADTRLEMHA